MPPELGEIVPPHARKLGDVASPQQESVVLRARDRLDDVDVADARVTHGTS